MGRFTKHNIVSWDQDDTTYRWVTQHMLNDSLWDKYLPLPEHTDI